MFCPKCKYTTFDFYKNCPKCNFEWNSIRKELGLDWMMEPDVIKATEIPEEEVEMKGDVALPKEEIKIELTDDISGQEEEIELDSSLMLDNEKEFTQEQPELIEPEIEITQEPEIEVVALEKEKKEDLEGWDIEFEDIEKKKTENNARLSEKNTESLIPEIDLEILLDEEEKQSKN